MLSADLAFLLELPRQKTLELLDAIAARPDAAQVLSWRPGPGRAHIGWQLMHLAATDDRHLHNRMAATPGEPSQPALVRRFGFGSTPDDQVPQAEEIRAYLNDRRQAVLSFVRGLAPEQLPIKPREDAPWTYQQWIHTLAWHEAHHHGQAHLTLNMYRAAFDGK